MKWWVAPIAMMSVVAVFAASPGGGDQGPLRWDVTGSVGHGWVEMRPALGGAEAALTGLASELEAEGFEAKWSVSGDSGLLVGRRGPMHVRGLYLVGVDGKGFFVVQRARLPTPTAGRTTAGDLPLHPGAQVTLSTTVGLSRILAYRVDASRAAGLQAFVEDRLRETGWSVSSDPGSSMVFWTREDRRLVVDFSGSDVVFIEEKVG